MMISDQTNKATEVKRRYGKIWLGMKGVISVGIGQINDRVGIIISVEGNLDQVRMQIPSDVDGIPTKVQVTGRLDAQ